MEDAQLIVGLGNPGRQYAGTRHNAGFAVVERLAGGWGWSWRLETGCQARLAQGVVDGRRVLLCQPQTYMNRSGAAVGPVAQFYRIGSERLLVVVDDADLPLGVVRLRPEGSAGGHHGLESVEQHLGTRNFARLRLGIGRRQPDDRQIADHVLGRFTADEARLFDEVLARAADAAKCWLFEGVGTAMNRFNGVVSAPTK
jgi:PTH1 family peptidyl-tRNA hydrolase